MTLNQDWRKEKLMTTHEKIQAKMNTDIEWQSINLAAEILEAQTDMVAFCRVLNKNAQTKEQIKTSSDVGDIYLISRDTKTVKVIEVKRLGESNIGKDFTSRETWKFQGFIVDGVYQLNNKSPKPYMYMCFNADLTAVAIFYTYNLPKCKQELKKGNESMKMYYVAELEDVKFKTVKELLTKKQN